MKRDAYKSIWVLTFIVTGLVAVVGMSRHFRLGKELIPWREDLPAAREQAAAGGKRVLLYFTASWCGPCQEMRRTVWTDARVAKALEGFVPVRIDVDREPALARQYQVEAMPWFAILDADGRMVRGRDGYMEADEFLEWVKGTSAGERHP